MGKRTTAWQKNCTWQGKFLTLSKIQPISALPFYFMSIPRIAIKKKKSSKWFHIRICLLLLKTDNLRNPIWILILNVQCNYFSANFLYHKNHTSPRNFFRATSQYQPGWLIIHASILFSINKSNIKYFSVLDTTRNTNKTPQI